MSLNKVYRIRGRKYNPTWLQLIYKTKSGEDKKDWKDFLLAWKVFTEEDNWDPWVNLLASWKKPRRFKRSELRRFDKKWKLTFSPTIGTGKGLARSNKALFDRIKTKLRARGEGSSCWACGTKPSRFMRLSAHEFWEFDYKNRVRRLRDIRFLCPDCHYLTHDANMMFLPLPDENVIRLTELFCRVNECKLIEAYSYLTFFALENYSDTGAWKTDLSELEAILSSPNKDVNSP